MARFVVGDDRSQSTLFPERLDDYLSEDNPVRAIDVFVYELDLLSRSRFIGVTDLSARAGRGGRVKSKISGRELATCLRRFLPATQRRPPPTECRHGCICGRY